MTKPQSLGMLYLSTSAFLESSANQYGQVMGEIYNQCPCTYSSFRSLLSEVLTDAPPKSLQSQCEKHSPHGMRIQISTMAEEEFNSVFLQPTPAHWPWSSARWHRKECDGTMLLGNCTATRIKELFPSGNLKELLFGRFIKAWHYLEHSCPKDKARREKENGHFFYNVENFNNFQKFLL